MVKFSKKKSLYPSIIFVLCMQASIDPNVGQADLSAMKKEADRMQLQLDGLISKRKQLIAGLESKVDNRKTINTKIEVCNIHLF